jgi:hypothetical protein
MRHNRLASFGSYARFVNNNRYALIPRPLYQIVKIFASASFQINAYNLYLRLIIKDILQ